MREGPETVLLVEDQESVRKFARLVLEGRGYIVLVAADGTEALQTTTAYLRLDALVTDMVMPGISGRELADELRNRFPGLRVLFVSGYTDQVVGTHGGSGANEAFLQKPFTPIALAQKVRDLLDGPS